MDKIMALLAVGFCMSVSFADELPFGINAGICDQVAKTAVAKIAAINVESGFVGVSDSKVQSRQFDGDPRGNFAVSLTISSQVQGTLVRQDARVQLALEINEIEAHCLVKSVEILN